MRGTDMPCTDPASRSLHPPRRAVRSRASRSVQQRGSVTHPETAPGVRFPAPVSAAVLFLLVSVAGLPAAAEPSAPYGQARSVASRAMSGPAPGAAVPVPAVADGPPREPAPHIVVHPRDVGDSLPASLVAVLEGLEPTPARVETRFIDLEVGTDQVRYFHEGDEAAADAVAAHPGRIFDAVAVRDFSSYIPSPSPGLIEVWVR